MQAAALIDYVPPQGPTLRSIAWLLGSPSPSPASWEKTKEWNKLERTRSDVIVEQVSVVLDVRARGLSEFPSSVQWEVLCKMAGNHICGVEVVPEAILPESRVLARVHRFQLALGRADLIRLDGEMAALDEDLARLRSPLPERMAAQ